MCNDDLPITQPVLGSEVKYQGERYRVMHTHRIGYQAPTYSLYRADGQWRHRVPAHELRPALCCRPDERCLTA
jgi:hypothetical protein